MRRHQMENWAQCNRAVTVVTQKQSIMETHTEKMLRRSKWHRPPFHRLSTAFPPPFDRLSTAFRPPFDRLSTAVTVRRIKGNHKLPNEIATGGHCY